MITMKESFIHKCQTDSDLTLRTDCIFNVYQIINEKYFPIGPNSVNDRIWKKRTKKDEEYYFDFEGNIALEIHSIKTHDSSGGDKMVEIIPESELSMYDRLRSELLSMMSEVSEKHGDESYEEANDLEIDDEDDDIPLTPYEFHDMKEEYLKENLSSLDQQEELETEQEVSSPEAQQGSTDDTPIEEQQQAS